MKNINIVIKKIDITEIHYTPYKNSKRFFIITDNMKIIFNIGNKYSACINISLLNYPDTISVDYQDIIIKDLINDNIFIYGPHTHYGYYKKHTYDLIEHTHQYSDPTFKFILYEKEEVNKIYKFITSVIYLNDDIDVFKLILKYDK